MKYTRGVCSWILLLVTLAYLTDATSYPKEALSINTNNYNSLCKKYPRILTLFTDKRCEACEAFEPQFKDLVKDFQPFVDQLVFGRVSCRTEADYLCRQYNIDTLPTLILIDDCQQGIRYRGKLTTNAVSEFIKKYLVSPTIMLQNKDELDLFKQDLNRLGVVGYFESKDDPKYTSFVQAARIHMNDYPYGVVFDADPEEYGVYDVPSIVLYKQGKELAYKWSGEFNAQYLIEWVSENSHLFLDTVALKDLPALLRSSIASVGIFWLPENYKTADLEQFSSLRDQYPHYFFIKVFVKPTDKDAIKVVVSSAVNIDNLPTFTFVHLVTEIYPLEEDDDLTLDNIQGVLDGFLEGSSKLIKKSAPIPDPEQEKDKLVKTIVFDNYYTTINQSVHDSLILFTSKLGCIRCPPARAALDELATILHEKHGEDLVIGEYVTDDNFIPELLTDIPALLYFRAGEMNAPRYITRNLAKVKFMFDFVKLSASFDFDAELPPQAPIEDDDDVHEQDLSPENMGVAQPKPDEEELRPEDIFGDVEAGQEEPIAAWMNNPIVITTVDDNTLQEFIDKNDHVLLTFVKDATSDGDFMEQVGVLSQQYGDRIAFGKVIAKTSPVMIEYFDIKEFPALKYFSLQEAIDMRDIASLTLPSIEIFLFRHLEEVARKFSTASELENYVSSDEGKTFWSPKMIVLAGVFTSDDVKYNKAFKSFMKTAEYTMASVQSAYTLTANVGLPEEFGLESVPALMLYSNNKRVAVLPMKEDVDVPISELSRWVYENGIPTVAPFSPYLYSYMYWNSKPLVVVFVDDTKHDEAAAQVKMLDELCTEFKGKIHCAYANGTDQEVVQSHLLQWDLKPDQLPQVVIEAWHVRDEGEYYPLRVDLTKDSLREHITKVLNREIKSHVKSEPVESFAPHGQVSKVVRKSLDEFIAQPDVEVLLYFTISDPNSCPNCPRVDKAVSKWAQKFSKFSNVVIGKFDVLHNDLPFKIWRAINEVPALLYYRSTNKEEPLKYYTSLEFKDLKEFMVNNGAQLKKNKKDD